MALTVDQVREVRYTIADVRDPVYDDSDIEAAIIMRTTDGAYDLNAVCADLLLQSKLLNPDFAPAREKAASSRAASLRLKSVLRFRDGSDTPVYPEPENTVVTDTATAGGEGELLFTHRTTLSLNDIKGLFETPIELIPAQGDGTYVDLRQFWIRKTGNDVPGTFSIPPFRAAISSNKKLNVSEAEAGTLTTVGENVWLPSSRGTFYLFIGVPIDYEDIVDAAFYNSNDWDSTFEMAGGLTVDSVDYKWWRTKTTYTKRADIFGRSYTAPVLHAFPESYIADKTLFLFQFEGASRYLWRAELDPWLATDDGYMSGGKAPNHALIENSALQIYNRTYTYNYPDQIKRGYAKYMTHMADVELEFVFVYAKIKQPRF